MDITSSTRWAGAALVVAICSACSGGGAVAPVAFSASGRYAAQTIVVDGRPITAERLNLGGIPRYPATAPVAGARTTSKHFDYVINLYTTYASIFDYPASTKQIGESTPGRSALVAPIWQDWGGTRPFLSSWAT